MADYRQELQQLLDANKNKEESQQKDDRLDYALILDKLTDSDKYSKILNKIKSDENKAIMNDENSKIEQIKLAQKFQQDADRMSLNRESFEFNRALALQKLEDAKIKRANKDNDLLMKLEEKRATKKDSEDFRRRSADESKYSKFMQQLAVTGRGTTFARNLREDINQSEIALNRIKAIEEGKLIGDKQTAVDISNSVSRLIAGGHPAIQLVDATLYKSLGGEANDWAQWISGHPQEYINSTQLAQIKDQILNIKDTKRKQYTNWESQLKGSINYILDRNEDLKKEFEFFHPKPFTPEEVNKSLKVDKAPHGNRVRQNGVTYIWNGSEYTEEK